LLDPRENLLSYCDNDLNDHDHVAACTTNRLSYIPTDECRISTKSFAPVHKYQPSDVSMECETTMRLSYQPVELAVRDEKTWLNTYHPPVDPMEDSTTYNLR